MCVRRMEIYTMIDLEKDITFLSVQNNHLLPHMFIIPY